MDKKQLKQRKKEYRKLAAELNLTSEQIAFLLAQYTDNDCIIGIHNTIYGYENIFRVGLYNQNSSGLNTAELSNTVNYNDSLDALLKYINMQQELESGQSIILKIPKKVFEQDQGIYEKLPDGVYGIPSEFIVGTFENKEIIKNEKYDKSYNNPNADKNNPSEHVIYCNKLEQADLFMEEYNRVHTSLKSRFKNFIQKFTQRKKDNQLLLESGEVEDKEHIDEKSRAELYKKQYANPINEKEIIKKMNANKDEQTRQDLEKY